MKLNDAKRFGHESIRTYNDKEVIFAEGEDSREMYIVQEGELFVSKRSGNNDVILATLKKGDFVGDMALLESQPRSATARAHGATTLLVLKPSGFLLKIRRDPTFAFEMLQHLSRRLRTTNERMLEAVQKSTSGDARERLKAIFESSEFGTVSDDLA
ncbi:MAG: cyclic nucleotide-binding domain-containing protein [Bdellovibrionota bacterium]